MMCSIFILKLIHIDSLYLVGLKRLKAEKTIHSIDCTGWMICEFANINNKQKPPITNLILDQTL